MVIWLIGLAGAGKTTIGRAVYDQLRERRPNVVFLDGDDLRRILGGDLGYTVEDRRRNAWRMCRLCAHLDAQGIDVVCAILSLFPETREWNRANFSRYFEVYINVPLTVLVARDQKGLYSGALAGTVPNVAGVDIPFSPPERPDLVVANHDPAVTPREQASRIIEALSVPS